MDKRIFSRDDIFNGQGTSAVPAVRSFLSSVFTYMALALVLSGAMAWWFGTNDALRSLLWDVPGKRSILGWVVMFAPLGLVMLMGGMVQRLSLTALLGTFVVYSILTGMSVSYIFWAYAEESIVSVFFMAALLFGIMAVAGYTTRTDLTKFGSILMIGLVAMIIASLVNVFFLNNGALGFVISIVGVLIFTGLTAYDMQKLKTIGLSISGTGEVAQKMAIMGALTLYLDFLNLFLLLLRLFGGRRD
jgi:uncharacterized protein